MIASIRTECLQRSYNNSSFLPCGRPMSCLTINLFKTGNNDESAQPIVPLHQWNITLRAFIVISGIGWDIEQTILEKTARHSGIMIDLYSKWNSDTTAKLRSYDSGIVLVWTIFFWGGGLNNCSLRARFCSNLRQKYRVFDHSILARDSGTWLYVTLIVFCSSWSRNPSKLYWCTYMFAQKSYVTSSDHISVVYENEALVVLYSVVLSDLIRMM